MQQFEESSGAVTAVPRPPERAPRMGNAFSRWVGRTLLRLMGWKLQGQFPNEPKLVLALAPHTSNWDFVIALAALMATGLKVSYLMKKEAFIWPFKRFFMTWGGIPLDRQAAQDTVEQINRWYQEHDKVWVVITPEGTRSKVERWKSGYLRLAYTAQVPVLLVTWDYPSKTMVIDRCWPLTGDMSADREAMEAYVKQHYRAKHPHNQ